MQIYTNDEWQYVFANKGVAISKAYSRKRKDNFPGSTVYYFEITQIATNASLLKFILNSNLIKVKLKKF
jgi:hypothetical protein